MLKIICKMYITHDFFNNEKYPTRCFRSHLREIALVLCHILLCYVKFLSERAIGTQVRQRQYLSIAALNASDMRLNRESRCYLSRALERLSPERWHDAREDERCEGAFSLR